MQMECKKDNDLYDIETFVGRSLQLGVVISATVIVVGMILFIASGEGGFPGDTYPTSFSTIWQGVLALKPYAIILLGLILLICTPIFRVGISILVFFKEKDWLYVGISFIVFIILISSFIFGK
ncbi:MAG: hypothetical protein H6Q74_750 [Firmicutes bacterium]|nr:hypothetical protein [Bacillota bacterium]